MGHEQSPREDVSRKEFKKPDVKSADDTGDNIVPMNNDIDFQRDDSLLQADTPLAATLRNIHDIEPSFDPSAFAGQAEMAYEAIVQAFANGDRSTLKDLLSEEVYHNFEMAIEAREKANEAMHTDILSVNSSEITGAVLNGKDAEVTVRFETEMISMTKDEEGVVVQGDPHPHTVREEWTFARRLKSRNPNWLLITTKSAE